MDHGCRDTPCLVMAGIGVAAVVLYLLSVYNVLIQVRNDIDKAWNNIDVLLQQRHDELNKLMDTVREYLKYERSVLESLTRLRVGYDAAQSTDEKVRIENQINKELVRLGPVWENYPKLQSSENVLQLQGRISAVESIIADRRELFNDSVNIYNISIQQLPQRLVAGVLGYAPHAFLEIPEEQKKDVTVSLSA